MKICPSCGRMRELNEFSGFCVPCSRGTCITCGSRFEPDHSYRKVCQYCRSEAWYQKYADQVESLLLLGFSLQKARELISRDNAPRCLSCGVLIKGRAADVTLFCTKHPQCRSWKRRYRWLKDTRYVGQSDVFPLVHVMLEVNFATLSTREERTAA